MIGVRLYAAPVGLFPSDPPEGWTDLGSVVAASVETHGFRQTWRVTSERGHVPPFEQTFERDEAVAAYLALTSPGACGW